MKNIIQNGCAVIRCWRYADGGNEGVSTNAPEGRRKNFRTEGEMFLWEEYFAPGEEVEVYDNGQWARYRVASNGELHETPMNLVRKTRIIWNDAKTAGIRTYYFEEVSTTFSTTTGAEFYISSRRINRQYLEELAMHYFGQVPELPILRDYVRGRNNVYSKVKCSSFEEGMALARLLIRQNASPDYFLTVEGNLKTYQEYRALLYN